MIRKLRMLKKIFGAVFFCLTGLLAPSGALAEDTLISPDDPAINYYGRFDFSNPKAPRFNWSGSTIELVVSGTTTVGIELIDGAGYFDVEVDGKALSTPINTNSFTQKRYDIVTGLSTDSHLIRVIRRNEPYWVIATFNGIYLSNGGKLAPKAKPVRKMEFCGDSYTAGYFVEDCDDQQAKTNANKSWARVTSKAFKAQDIILAESGIGLVKGLGGKTTFPKKYSGIFDTMGVASTPMWKFSSWIPDIMTIFLGINDKSCGATDNEFITGIHDFVKTIRSNYPTTPILFMSMTGCMDQATQTAVAAETTSLGHKDVYFLLCKQQVHGCSWHPTVDDDKEIADSVVAKIKQITGWDTTTVSVADADIKKVAHSKVPINAVQIDRNTILISTQEITAGKSIQIISANGQILKKLKFDLSGNCIWNTSETSEGVYFIGGLNTGWTRVLVRR